MVDYKTGEAGMYWYVLPGLVRESQRVQIQVGDSTVAGSKDRQSESQRVTESLSVRVSQSLSH